MIKKKKEIVCRLGRFIYTSLSFPASFFSASLFLLYPALSSSLQRPLCSYLYSSFLSLDPLFNLFCVILQIIEVQLCVSICKQFKGTKQLVHNTCVIVLKSVPGLLAFNWPQLQRNFRHQGQAQVRDILGKSTPERQLLALRKYELSSHLSLQLCVLYSSR